MKNNYDQVIKILMKESKEIKMMKEITYLEVEVKRLPSINQNSFSVMVNTILQDQSLQEEIFVIKDNKVCSGKLYKNMCYGVIDTKAQEMISKAVSDGYTLHSIMPNIQCSYFVKEYYDTEYEVFVGPTESHETTLKLMLLYEKDSEPDAGGIEDSSPEVAANQSENDYYCKIKHNMPF